MTTKDTARPSSTPMAISEFRKLPLIKAYISVDRETQDLLRNEVRREEATGLTLRATFPLA